MNDKEKKAIEKIEKKILIGECEKSIGVPIYISDLKIVLNLIENQKAELEKKDIALKECERNLIEERQNRIKKDKQIDLMAEWLYKDDTSFGYGNLKDVNTSEKIKQYFEKKTEEIPEQN